jgi:hypothetical protein
MQEFDNVGINFHKNGCCMSRMKKKIKSNNNDRCGKEKPKCNGKYNIGKLMDQLKFLTPQRVSAINW